MCVSTWDTVAVILIPENTHIGFNVRSTQEKLKDIYRRSIAKWHQQEEILVTN